MAKINLALPDDLQAAIDAARGDIPRTRWIIRAIEAALADNREVVVLAGRQVGKAQIVREITAGLGKGPVAPRPKGKR